MAALLPPRIALRALDSHLDHEFDRPREPRGRPPRCGAPRERDPRPPGVKQDPPRRRDDLDLRLLDVAEAELAMLRADIRVVSGEREIKHHLPVAFPRPLNNPPNNPEVIIVVTIWFS